MDFDPQVLEAVALLTKDRSLTYKQNIEKIINSRNPIAMMVKLKSQNEDGAEGIKESTDVLATEGEFYEREAQQSSSEQNFHKYARGSVGKDNEGEEDEDLAVEMSDKLSVRDDGFDKIQFGTVDEDSMSILTVETTKDDDEPGGDDKSFSGSSQSGNTTTSKHIKKNSSGAKTIRGWSIFGNARGGAPSTNISKHSRKSTASTIELSIIEEGKDTSERFDQSRISPDTFGTFSSKYVSFQMNIPSYFAVQ
jgi:hypothetical protein